MAQLIDKSALVAEIEKLYNGEIDTYTRNILDRLKSNIDTLEVTKIGVDLGDPKGDKSAKYIIDTNSLEVKEVDLEDYNKVKGMLSLSFMQFLDSHSQEGKMCLSNGECFDIDKAFDEMDFAKLFRYMEKYLKAQKGE